MMPRIGVACLMLMLAASAQESAELASLRNLASAMLKRKDLGADSAYCEFAPVSQVDGCSGLNRNALRYRIGRNGLVESWHYRSPGESGDPIGSYRGRLDKTQWRSLLQTLSEMKWSKAEGMPPGPPLPPGPTETISILTLSDGKQRAAYSRTGPGPAAIDAGMYLPGQIARSSLDTIWELSLVRPKAEIRKDSVIVTADWNWRGPTGSRVLFSGTAGGEYCGKADFKWYLDTSEFTAEWHRASTDAPKGPGLVWNLAPGKAAPVRLAFTYDGPKGKAKRMGALAGVAIRIVPGGMKDTVSATVFTDPFGF